jgi:hypothetical protein
VAVVLIGLARIAETDDEQHVRLLNRAPPPTCANGRQ